jgi:signal transduction histidine kinase/DNA-binding response OmpR family regulator
MKYISGKEIIARIDQYLADPRLDAESQLRKRWVWLWLVVTCAFVLVTVSVTLLVFRVWPLWWFGAVFIAGYFIVFSLYRRALRFDLVVNIIFSIFILAALFAILQVGGLISSMGYVFIGMNCAMGSILAGNLRWTIGMFVLYCITILLVGFFQPLLTTPAYITPHVNTLSIVGLTLWINASIFFIVILFMIDKDQFEKSRAENLKKTDEAKTRLFTNVSHEFRTPLTVIEGIAEQMELHPEQWIKNGPAKIKVQSRMLLRMVNQMLNIAKIEANQMPVNFINGDIRLFVRYIAESFQSLADNMKITLIVDKNKDSVYTDYDPDKMMHVISNILSNAIKFTAPGGYVKVDIRTVVRQNKKEVHIRFRDTGKGIPKKSVEKIFDRFYQVSDEICQTPGTGLGLAVSSEMVKLMHGEISVESEPGKGSLFTVILPFKEKAEKTKDHGISMIDSGMIHPHISKIDVGNKLNETDDSSREYPILLIVEDNKDVAEYIQSILTERFRIELAWNGIDGFRKAGEIIPDIILTDVMMPQMDGFEMLGHLKNDIRTDHIPVVVLTARVDFESKLIGLETGADHYLIKPFNEKELLLKLNNLLELRRKMQKHFDGIPFRSPFENVRYKPEYEFLNRINALIEKEMGNENFGINAICLSMNMSRAQLYRKFSAITNKSIGRYLRSYRLYNAKKLLEKQGRNVTEAAFESGFRNLSHFSTCFHEEFGFAPHELVR